MGTRLNRENLAVGHIGPEQFNEPISGKEKVLKVGRYDGQLPVVAPFLITLEDGTDRYEVVKVTKVAPGPVFTVQRGQEGTSPVDHPTPCTFNFGITNQELADLVGRLAVS